MAIHAKKKIQEAADDMGFDKALKQGKEAVESAADRSGEAFKQAGEWFKENNSSLVGVAAIALSVGLFSYLLTRGRRFIIVI